VAGAIIDCFEWIDERKILCSDFFKKPLFTNHSLLNELEIK